jgi:hypothetical protein
MAIDTTIIMYGVFGLLFVIVSIIIGLKIILKYKEFKEKTYVFVGITWIGMSKPWWASSFAALTYLIYGVGFPVNVYILTNFSFIAVFLIIWLLAIKDLLSIKKFNIVIILVLIYTVIYETIILYYLATDVSVLGVLLSPVDIDLGLLLIVYLLINLVIFIVFGFYFAIQSLKSEVPEVKLKGKLLLLAFILYLLGATLDILISFPPNRLILILSGILFYIGFLMPNAIKKRFIK